MMETNTSHNSTRTNDPIDQFLGQILDEKKITAATPEVRQQLIDDLRFHLMGQIDRAMVNALSAEQVTRLNQLLDQEDLTDQQVQEFFRSSGIDGERVALDTMIKFRQYYLGSVV